MGSLLELIHQTGQNNCMRSTEKIKLNADLHWFLKILDIFFLFFYFNENKFLNSIIKI